MEQLIVFTYWGKRCYELDVVKQEISIVCAEENITSTCSEP